MSETVGVGNDGAGPRSLGGMASRPSTFAVTTYALLGLNTLVFLHEASLGAELDGHLRRWGTVAADVWAAAQGTDPSPAALVTLLSGMFLHAGWVHLAANMLYLWVFGARVEKALGGARLLTIYLLAGVVAGVCQVVAAPGVGVPAVGASGALAGVMGAFLMLEPGVTMAAFAPRWFYSRGRDLPAAALVALWLVSQLLWGALALAGATQVQAVGWWAHVAGLASGALVGAVLARRSAALAWSAARVARLAAQAKAGHGLQSKGV